MMVVIRSEETKKSSTSIQAHDRKSITSKTSIASQKSDEVSRPKSSSGSHVPKLKKSSRTRSKTVEAKQLDSLQNKVESEISPKENTKESNMEIEMENKTKEASEKSEAPKEQEPQSEMPEEKLNNNHTSDTSMISVDSKSGKPKPDTRLKKQSEIPKLRTFGKSNSAVLKTSTTGSSRLPVKSGLKETQSQVEQRPVQTKIAPPTPVVKKTEVTKEEKPEMKRDEKLEVKKEEKPEIKREEKLEVKKEEKPEIRKEEKLEVKKEDKVEMKKEEKPEVKKEEKFEVRKEERPEMKKDDKIQVRKEEKLQMKKDEKLEEVKSGPNDYSYIVPLFEKEMKKVSDAWVNTIYCSLTMRTNLAKLLYQAFPNINRSQFQMEDERLLQCIAQAKNFTTSEADNLIHFIRILMASHGKVKEQYDDMTLSKEISEQYNNDWRKLNRKIVEVTEEVKQIQSQIPDLQKKREANLIAQREKIKKTEQALESKDEELKKLANQLNILKEKETYYTGSPALNESYKELKAHVLGMKGITKEYQELRTKFLSQNETYEKKIKELETLLDDKKKLLDKEKNVKKQLQSLINQMHTHQKVFGKEQMAYVMRKSGSSADKRREKLWLAAVKLVVRGFQIQMKKLERDRNRMLLELHATEGDNFNDLAMTLIRKENFIKTIKSQIADFQKAVK